MFSKVGHLTNNAASLPTLNNNCIPLVQCTTNYYVNSSSSTALSSKPCYFLLLNSVNLLGDESYEILFHIKHIFPSLVVIGMNEWLLSSTFTRLPVVALNVR